MSKVTISETSMLAEVLKVDPHHYDEDVAYEFSKMRGFPSSDKSGNSGIYNVDTSEPDPDPSWHDSYILFPVDTTYFNDSDEKLPALFCNGYCNAGSFAKRYTLTGALAILLSGEDITMARFYIKSGETESFYVCIYDEANDLVGFSWEGTYGLASGGRVSITLGEYPLSSILVWTEEGPVTLLSVQFYY
jgi:hypothetical protein